MSGSAELAAASSSRVRGPCASWSEMPSSAATLSAADTRNPVSIERSSARLVTPR